MDALSGSIPEPARPYPTSGHLPPLMLVDLCITTWRAVVPDIDLSQAAHWNTHGFTPAQTAAWLAAGFAANEAQLAQYYSALMMEPVQGCLQRLVDDTADLIEQADMVELWHADQAADIADAHRRGITLAELQDRRDRAQAYVESGDYAQDLWEREAFAETDADADAANSYGETLRDRYLDQEESKDAAEATGGAVEYHGWPGDTVDERAAAFAAWFEAPTPTHGHHERATSDDPSGAP